MKALWKLCFAGTFIRIGLIIPKMKTILSMWKQWDTKGISFNTWMYLEISISDILLILLDWLGQSYNYVDYKNRQCWHFVKVWKRYIDLFAFINHNKITNCYLSLINRTLIFSGNCNRLPLYTKTVQIYKLRKFRNNYPREKRVL